MAINNTSSDLAVELQKIYDSEINVKIGWLWDGGIENRLGDDMNGYLAEEAIRMATEMCSLAARGDCSFLPGIVLRALTQPGTQGARSSSRRRWAPR
jgi:hypothetical protein